MRRSDATTATCRVVQSPILFEILSTVIVESSLTLDHISVHSLSVIMQGSAPGASPLLPAAWTIAWTAGGLH